MATPLITVITPIFNAEKFLLQTLHSISEQTYSNFEALLIIDFNSSDSSEKMSLEFAKKDSRFRVIKPTQAEGAGVAVNRNMGLAQALGEYICFLDSDDLWVPTKLALQLAFMQKNSCRFSCTGYSKISESGSELGRYQTPYSRASRTDLLKDNRIGCLTVMLKKELAQEFTFQNVMHEDLLFWLQVLATEKVCLGLNENLAKYRIVKGSRSNNKWVALRGRWNLLRNHEKLNFVGSLYYFFQYGFQALLKYSH